MTEHDPYNPLEALLHDSEITEIMVNGPAHIFAVRQGHSEKIEGRFETVDHLMLTMHRLLDVSDTPVDTHAPVLRACLPGGWHLTAVLPPLVQNGPSLTLVKQHTDTLTSSDLIRSGALTQKMVDFLNACVAARLNMIVAGGTASGKTTVTNILTGFIPEHERVITVEAMPHLQVRHHHNVVLQCQPSDQAGQGGTSVAELIRLATLMRPDRIIVGELDGPEALEAIQVMGRGYDGSMTMLHANTPHEALIRLEMMIKLHHSELPVESLRGFIGSTVNIVVQCNRLLDGSRKITSIAEVLSTRGEGCELYPVFTFVQTGKNEQGKIVGEYRSRQVNPGLAQRLQWLGVVLPDVVPAREA